MIFSQQETSLVLEGGGMRGVFTSGVLDYLLDNDLHLPYTIGVSAGACNGLSYISHQRGRARMCNIELLEKYRYIQLSYLLTKGSLMDFDLLFDDFPNRILPYDYNTCFTSGQRFIMVASNCLTGEAEYLEEKHDPKRLLNICRASSSLPFFCPVTHVDNRPMLDGGICDAIPIKKAIADGYDRHIIVLTRNKDYRKNTREITIPSFIYRQYPAIRQRMKVRSKEYNDALDFIENLEKKGKAIVIRPKEKIGVNRLERNTGKLIQLYNQGYECARQQLQAVF